MEKLKKISLVQLLCLQILILSIAFSQPQRLLAKEVKTEIVKKDRDVLDSKTVRKITKRQSQRLDKINSYKAKGFIGENTLGLLSLRGTDGLNKKEISVLKKIMDLENKDREKLIQILIQTNRYNKEQEKTLRLSLFRSRFDVDPNGTYYFQDTYWHKK